MVYQSLLHNCAIGVYDFNTVERKQAKCIMYISYYFWKIVYSSLEMQICIQNRSRSIINTKLQKYLPTNTIGV